MAKHFTPYRISENIRETNEGYLFCLGVPIARTGWQDYGPDETPLEVGADGLVKVYRSKEEVFRPETVASFQGKPITIKHPQDFVKPENWQNLSRGTAHNVRPGTEEDEDGEWPLLADLLVTEVMAINLIKNGLREISCGYEAEYEQTSEGQGRQFNIVGNHIALVEDGRAGSTYAIRDHKGKVKEMPNLMERLRAKFGTKAVDEVLAEEAKAGKTTDADPDKKDDGDKKMMDASAYDELMKAVKDLGAKVEGLAKPKDEEKKPEPKKDDDKAKDDEEEEGGKSMEDRMTALETAVAKLLEKKSDESEEEEESEDEDGDDDESEDDDGEEESEDDGVGAKTLTGDTASRVEILAPGLKKIKGEPESKFKARAINAAYATKDGKAVINTFTGGKKPVLDSAEKINMIFAATSEVLKSERGNGLAGTKDPTRFKTEDGQVKSGAISADELNEINAKHYGSAK